MTIRKIYKIDILWTSIHHQKVTLYKRTAPNKKKKICRLNKEIILHNNKLSIYSKTVISLQFIDVSLSDSIFEISWGQLSLC